MYLLNVTEEINVMREEGRKIRMSHSSWIVTIYSAIDKDIRPSFNLPLSGLRGYLSEDYVVAVNAKWRLKMDFAPPKE